ncbi:uncharacterized protein LOC108038981 [Drosophila rhopaloa]|uniref:Uncharacterized protein n=1 Tax=Drosophila rhopaloa TaxID=1041015 RepID=A0ABM5GXT1_DRORH|nr:uncharacterized protein LOC108038981 [Drosophila rhopaloa]
MRNSITFHELLLYRIICDMFKLIPFSYQFCALGNSYDVIADACRDKTELFSFLDSKQWRSFRRNVESFLRCDFAYYHIYYWFILIFSLYGAMHSLFNFGRLIFTKEVSSNSLWHNHRFNVLPPIVIRRLGLVKAFIQINVWSTLLYGALFVSPNHMAPWLWGHLVIIVFKLAAAILMRIRGQRLRTTIYLIVYMLTIWLVRQSMRAFFIALEQETQENLMLYLPIIQPLLHYGNSFVI